MGAYGSEIPGGFGVRGGYPAQVHPPRETDHRADEHLHTADEEQPGTRGDRVLTEEQDAADDEPDTDQNVIGDRDDFIALPDDQLFTADMHGQRLLGPPLTDLLMMLVACLVRGFQGFRVRSAHSPHPAMER